MVILLPRLPKCWNYRREPKHPALEMYFIGWLENESKDGYYEYAGGACDPSLEVKGVRNGTVVPGWLGQNLHFWEVRMCPSLTLNTKICGSVSKCLPAMPTQAGDFRSPAPM